MIALFTDGTVIEWLPSGMDRLFMAFDREFVAWMAEPLPLRTPEAIPQTRSGMAAIGRALPGADLADVQEHDADGVPVRLYRPTSMRSLPLLAFLHGGGWLGQTNVAGREEGC